MNMSRVIKNSRRNRQFLGQFIQFCEFSSIALTSFSLIVFLFYLHFCLLSYFEIIRCFMKSLMTTSTYFLMTYNWKKKIWKVIFGCQNFGIQAGIPVFQMAWIHHWVQIIKKSFADEVFGICFRRLSWYL